MNRNKHQRFGFMRTAALVLATALATACNSAADANVFSMAGSSQTKPNASVALGQSFGATSTTPTQAATVSYLVTVTSGGGVKVCNGQAQIVILSNFTMQFPVASISCLNMTIDLASMLGASLSNGANNNLANFSSDGKVLSTKALAAANFNPPRPFLLGPVIQDASVYQGFNQTYPTTLTGTNATTGQTYDAPGQFSVQVLKVGTTYANNDVGQAFNAVMDWKISTSGFTGVPASMGLLFQSMEWFWNVNPIMIPKIVITGDLSDFISSGTGGASSSSQLLGLLTIDLSVQSYNFSE